MLNNTDAYEEGNADEIIDNIESGAAHVVSGRYRSRPNGRRGSRITACRSIPICGRCGSDEVYEQLDGAQGYGWGLSSAGCWPIPVDEINKRRARYQQQAKPAILTADGHLVTKDGSTPVTNPCNTGGWAQYGTAEAD